MPLLIAGSGTQCEERRLKALLDASGCHARWVGHVTGRRKQQLLKDSAFMVLPSRYEAFGLAALESMSYGKPVVHFNLPSLRWMKGDIRVPLFNVGAVGREMHSVANDGAGAACQAQHLANLGVVALGEQVMDHGMAFSGPFRQASRVPARPARASATASSALRSSGVRC